MRRSFIRSVNITTAFFFALSISIYVNAADTPQGHVICDYANATITGDDLRIREAPSTDSRILGKLKKGTRVDALGATEFTDTIDGYTDYWIYIRTGKEYGYVFGRYLKTDHGYHLYPIKPFYNAGAIVTGDGVRIRHAPHVEAKILGKLNKGAKIEVIFRDFGTDTVDGYTDYWYYIKYRNIYGYMFGRYVGF